MANLMQSTLPTDYGVDLQQNEQRKALAQALLQQSLESGNNMQYVPSGTGTVIATPGAQFNNGVANIAKTLLAKRAITNANQNELAVASAARDRLKNALMNLQNLKGPQDYIGQGADLMGVPGGEQIGQSLLNQGVQNQQRDALLARFGYGQPILSQNGGAPLPQNGGELPGATGMPPASAAMPDANPMLMKLPGTPDGPGAPAMPAQGGMPPNAPGGFDMRRYAAEVGTGDPVLMKIAEAERAGTQVPAGTQATLGFDQYKFGHLSANQEQELKLKAASLGIDYAKLGLEQKKTLFAALEGYNQTGNQAYLSAVGMGAPGAPAPQQAPGMPAPPPGAQSPTPPASTPPAPGAPQPHMSPKDASETAKQVAIAREKNEPKVFQQLLQYRDQNALVNAAIERSLQKINGWTAGGGAILGNIPGTAAKDLAAELDTIKANVGFQALAQMRANSPTGGALGNVSEMENKLLQSTLGSLDQAQTPQQLKESLQRVQAALAQSQERLVAAYQEQYGGLPSQAQTQGGMQPHWNVPQSGVKDWNHL